MTMPSADGVQDTIRCQMKVADKELQGNKLFYAILFLLAFGAASSAPSSSLRTLFLLFGFALGLFFVFGLASSAPLSLQSFSILLCSWAIHAFPSGWLLNPWTMDVRDSVANGRLSFSKIAARFLLDELKLAAKGNVATTRNILDESPVKGATRLMAVSKLSIRC